MQIGARAPRLVLHRDYTPSIQIMKQILSDRMYPLTLEGLDLGIANAESSH